MQVAPGSLFAVPLLVCGYGAAYAGRNGTVRELSIPFRPGAGVSLASFRTPYPEGLYRIGASRLYVSRGIGTTFTPVRLNVPPEVTLVDLTVRIGDATGHG